MQKGDTHHIVCPNQANLETKDQPACVHIIGMLASYKHKSHPQRNEMAHFFSAIEYHDQNFTNQTSCYLIGRLFSDFKIVMNRKMSPAVQ